MRYVFTYNLIYKALLQLVSQLVSGSVTVCPHISWAGNTTYRMFFSLNTGYLSCHGHGGYQHKCLECMDGLNIEIG